jgi:arabinose-5-phosphate isomerase
MDVLQEAKRVFEIESSAVTLLADRLDESFEKAVEIILGCRDRVVLTGVGKTGIIARKIAATLASTGTPSFYMHPSEGIHGDLGMITRNNVVIAVSYSGNSEEVLALIPYFKHFDVKLIAMTGDPKSELAEHADIILNIHVNEEACPLGLAPTASTTAAMAMGDALAVVLVKKRDFKAEQFAISHPGGALGKRLLIKVSDLMHSGDENPVINSEATLKEAILEMTSKGLGSTSIVNDQGKLIGIITDGDLRRIMQSGKSGFDTRLEDVMIHNPKRIEDNVLAVKALALMEKFNITVLPVVSNEGQPIAMIHIHDLIKAGIIL